MSRQHKIKVTQDLEALGIELCDFTASITVNIIPESGDGWNEPREPGYYEMDSVVQLSGPHIKPDALSEWATEWVDANQEAIYDDISARSEVDF